MPAGWHLWMAGLVAGLVVLASTTVFWQVGCPGSAEASTQRDLCDSVGPWGGALVMAVGLAVGLAASALVLRRGLTPVIVVAALLLPVAGPFVSYAALTSPRDRCTGAQEREEAAAVRAWKESTNKPKGPRPTSCTAVEGS